MFQKMKTKKASVLVVAMTIFFILVIIALGISGFAIIERKSSGTSSQSDKAFQVADSGVEIVRGRLSGFLPTDSLSAYGNKLSCGISGDVDGSIPSGGSYVVSFYAADGITKLNCNTAQYSAVAMIKSVGTYSGATRAVEVAVAAGPGLITEKLNCIINKKKISSGIGVFSCDINCSPGYMVTGCMTQSIEESHGRVQNGARPLPSGDGCRCFHTSDRPDGFNVGTCWAVCAKII